MKADIGGGGGGFDCGGERDRKSVCDRAVRSVSGAWSRADMEFNAGSFVACCGGRDGPA